MCTPIIDGHAVYFLLLPGPGGIVHKLLSGISPLTQDPKKPITYYWLWLSTRVCRWVLKVWRMAYKVNAFSQIED